LSIGNRNTIGLISSYTIISIEIATESAAARYVFAITSLKTNKAILALWEKIWVS